MTPEQPVALREVLALLAEVERLQRELDECVRSHQKQNVNCEQATDLLIELRGWQLEASGAPKELLDRLNTFLESE